MATVLVSGASGFIGSRLSKTLAADGHRVVRLARAGSRPAPATSSSIQWDPERGSVDRDDLQRVAPDIVVNLAGEPISRRWTRSRRGRIRSSRVNGTRALAEALASLPERPRVLVSGSAVGYYGAQRGDEVLDESSSPGIDFLADVAREWEGATAAASGAGIRTVLLRSGVVLGQRGGALARLLPPFRAGVGGRIGTGRQWMSWIALDDMVRIIAFAISSDAVSGPLNVVAPEPVRNAEFTDLLAKVLRRPAVFPVPSTALRLVFGAMADNTILASQRVIPKRLAGAGFEFRHPRVEDALRFELRR